MITDEIDPSLFDAPATPVLDIEPEPGEDMRDLLPSVAPDAPPAAEDVRGIMKGVPRAPEPAALAIAEVLPSDFPLPALVRWVPNQALRVELQQVTSYALGLTVTGAEGLQAADAALATVRAKAKAVEVHFDEPAQIANSLHKAITGRRAEWLKDALDAIQVVGRRMAGEKRRLDDLAADQRRKDQEAANAAARVAAAKSVEVAAQHGAPEPVVAQMRQAAAVVTAPPVPVSPIAPTLAHTTVTKTWRARIAGTPADAEPRPAMADLTPAQQHEVRKLLAAVVAGTLPLTLLELNYGALNDRAKAEKGTLAIPGIEAYEDIGTRAKPGRRA